MPSPGQPWHLGPSHLDAQCHLLVCDSPCSQVQPVQCDVKMACRPDKGSLGQERGAPQKKGAEAEAGGDHVPAGKNEKQETSGGN